MATTHKPSDINLVKAADYKIVYANHIRVGMTMWDIQIGFAHNVAVPEPTPEAKLPVTDLVGVTLTVANAKVLATILNNIVRDYEGRFGKIEIKSEFLDPVDIHGNIIKS